MPKLIQENIRVSDTALQDFYQTIFRWTKYCFSSSSPWRVMNNRLYSGERINGNNPAYKNATRYFSNNSYSRCLIKPAIKLSKHYRDKIRLKSNHGASLVAQWLRICLPRQGTRVRALVWEDPTCRRATRPVSHNYWARASGACAPQQERPRQWKARAPRWRVAPTCRN